MTPIPISDVNTNTRADGDTLIREVNSRFRRLAHACDEALRWDEIRVPAHAIGLGLPTNPPTADTTYGGLLFNGVATINSILFTIQMPHGWVEGTNIVPHVHWTKTSNASGNVVWKLSYRHAPLAAVFDSSWTTNTKSAVSAETPDTNTSNKHLITNFDSISMSGRKMRHVLICQLERLPSDASDNYVADARLLGFDFSYQSDYPGGSLYIESKGVL